jgi:hypothetical protein
MSISNTAGRIAELRRRIASNKGKIDRALTTRLFLDSKIRDCRVRIAADQDEIEAMGGKVRR